MSARGTWRKRANRASQSKLDSPKEVWFCSCIVLSAMAHRPMSLIHNERTKLTATWFNTLATATVTAGALAPLIAVIYGLSVPAIEPSYLVMLAAACFGIGAAIHWWARKFLGRL